MEPRRNILAPAINDGDGYFSTNHSVWMIVMVLLLIVMLINMILSQMLNILILMAHMLILMSLRFWLCCKFANGSYLWCCSGFDSDSDFDEFDFDAEHIWSLGFADVILTILSATNANGAITNLTSED